VKKIALRRSLLSVNKLARSFFARPAAELARELIGKILVRRLRGKEFRARVVETEAYLGPHDLASHASRGRTRRTEVLFGPAGRAYVYLIYGVYEMLNVVAGAAGEAQGVLIRAADPLDGWYADLSGPGRLTRAFHISRSEDGLDLTGDRLYFLDDPAYQPRLVSAKRVGIDYAREWKDARLRFLDADRAQYSPRRRRKPLGKEGGRGEPPGGRQPAERGRRSR
jgi:DNA-3-methyladenine glycosylase